MPAISEDNSFVLNIRANPDDEMARLVYADYLEERGDPRGELIRLQCELAALAADDPRAPELTAREDELLAAYGEEWLAPLRELGAMGVTPRCFRRGLIERIVISAVDFAARAEEICRAEPALHIVQLKHVRDSMDALEQVKLPEQVRCLDLSANGLTRLPAAVGLWSGQIEELNLAFNRLDEDLAPLTADTWPKLARLNLARNHITQGSLAMLAWSRMPQLHSISLALNRIEWVGLLSLVTLCPHDRIEELDLASIGLHTITGNFNGQTIPWGRLSRLKRLILRNNRITAEGLRPLASLDSRQLVLLDLRNTPAGGQPLRRVTTEEKDSVAEVLAELKARFGDALIL